MDNGTDKREWWTAMWVIIRRFGWLPLLVLLSHELGAHVLDIYAYWPPFDIPIHLIGGFAFAFLCAGALSHLSEQQFIIRPDNLVKIVLVFALMCTSTVFWEFAEWTADHTIGTHSQLGLDDTLSDMLCGIMGGVIFLLAWAWTVTRGESSNLPFRRNQRRRVAEG